MRPRTSLIDLIGLKKLREFQERFYKATGFPNSYVDSEGNYVSKAGEAAHVCMNIIREAKEGNRRCVANDIRRTEPVEAKSQGPRIYKCHAGIWDASVPIISDGEHLGFIFIGQCLTESPNKSEATAYAKELGIDPDLYWENYNALPLVPYEKIEQAANLLFFMAAALAEEVSGKIKARLEIDRLEAIEKALRESDEQYRTIGETVPYGVWLTDAIGYCTYVSESFLELVDMTMEQIQEFGWLHLLPPEDVAPTKEHWLHCVETGEHFEREHRFMAKDGNCRNVLAIGRPIKDDTRKIVKWVGLNLDITERKQAEEAMRVSENRYRSVTETVTDGIILQAASGEILTWNKGAEEIFGISVKDAIGQTSKGNEWTTIHEDGSPYEGKDHPSIQTLQTGKPCRNEIMGVRQPSGEIRWISINTNPLFKEKQTKPYAVAISFSDITERKRTEEALKESEQKYRHLVESTDDWIWACDLDGRQTFTNEVVKEILGYEVHEIIGVLGDSLMHPEDAKRMQKWFIKSVEEKKGWKNSILRWKHKDGSIKYLESTARPILDSEGNLTGFIGIDRNITDRKQAEEQRGKLISDLQKTLSEVKTLRGFLPICSHCKKIRDDKGYWNQIEAYIQDHSEAEFSHGICQECAKKYYPDMDLYDEDETQG